MHRPMQAEPRASRPPLTPALLRVASWPRAATSVGLLALAASFAAGCQSRPVAGIDLCVLRGTTIDQGCATSPDGSPLIDIGATAFNKQSSKVIAIDTTGEGGDSLTVTGVAFNGLASDKFQLALYTLGFTGEQPVNLPFTLYPPSSGKVCELRVRVTFTASQPGPIPWEELKIETTDSADSIPIVGSALERVIGTPFTACVLKGVEVSQGCEVDAAGKPVVDLGTTGFGKQSSKVIAFTSTGQDGEPINLTELKLEGQSSLNLQLAAFTLTTAGEVPVQLPLTLYPPGSGKVSEVRARVTLTASTPGTVQLQGVKAATADYAVAVPAAGTALDRLKVPLAAAVACGAGDSCKTETVDACAHLPDLASGEAFTVRFDNVGSSWSNNHEMLVHFTKGTADTFTESTSGDKINITKLFYDGACGVYASSQYSGDKTKFFQAQARISDVSYGAL